MGNKITHTETEIVKGFKNPALRLIAYLITFHAVKSILAIIAIALIILFSGFDLAGKIKSLIEGLI
jgi:hypothetical protein